MSSASNRATMLAPFRVLGSSPVSIDGSELLRAKARRSDEAAAPSAMVMLLLDHRSSTLVAIRRATRIADALDANLEVILAIPDGTAGRHPSLISAHVSDLVAALRPRRDFTMEVVSGHVVDVGADLARERRADLVVVDAGIGASAATRLVEKSSTPVLLARDARGGGEVVAASDMRDRRLPVLDRAREIAHALDRKIRFLHNAKPMPVYVTDPMAGPTTYAGMLELQESLVSAKASRLRAFAGRDELAAIVSRSASTPDAILETAQFHEADLIVVGHRPRPWIARVLGKGVAGEVADRSRRSVLIVPLPRTKH